MNSISDFLPSI